MADGGGGEAFLPDIILGDAAELRAGLDNGRGSLVVQGVDAAFGGGKGCIIQEGGVDDQTWARRLECCLSQRSDAR